MIEAKLQIPALGNEAYFFHPDGTAQLPGIVFLTDIWGVRDAAIGMAKRVAEKGYAVLLPNAFFRYASIDTVFEPGDPADRDKVMNGLRNALPEDKMASDGTAYVEFLLSQKNVTPGKVGVVGHCYTGQMALRIAAAAPGKVAAAASFHGGRLVSDKPDSAHSLLGSVKASLYFGHADQDASMNADHIKTLEAALAAWGGTYKSETYSGAKHGWTVPDRPVFNQAEAERAFQNLIALLDGALK